MDCGGKRSATPLLPARHRWNFIMRPVRPKTVSLLRSAPAVQNASCTRKSWQSRQRLGVRAALRRYARCQAKLLPARQDRRKTCDSSNLFAFASTGNI